MGYNPPITRDEVRDTLRFMGIDFTYEKISEPGRGHVFAFEIQSGFIDIYGPSFIKYKKKKYSSHRELVDQLAIDYPSSCN